MYVFIASEPEWRTNKKIMGERRHISKQIKMENMLSGLKHLTQSRLWSLGY